MIILPYDDVRNIKKLRKLSFSVLHDDFQLKTVKLGYAEKNAKNVIFGGRLGNYKYYDMDKTISEALKLVSELID